MAPCQHTQDNTCANELCSNEQTYPVDFEHLSRSSPAGMDGTLPSGVDAPYPPHYAQMPPVHDGAGAPLIPCQHENAPSSAAAVYQSFGHPHMGGMSAGWQVFPHVPRMPDPRMGYASQQHPAGQPNPMGRLFGHGANGALLSPPQEPLGNFPAGNANANIGSAMATVNAGGPPNDYWSFQTAPAPAPLQGMNGLLSPSAASGPLQGMSGPGMQGVQSHPAYTYQAASAQASPAALVWNLGGGAGGSGCGCGSGSGSGAKEGFQCPLCSDPLGHKSSLRRHLKRKHAEAFWVYVVDDQRPAGQPSAVALDKPLGECHECSEGKPYGQQDGAKAHLTHVHGAHLAGSGGDGSGTMKIDMFRRLIRKCWVTRAAYADELERIQRKG